jgi:hypothetical protein
MNKIEITAKNTAQKILAALGGGLNEAAEIYAQYISSGGDPVAIRKASSIPNNVWSALEDIAAGRVDTRLFFLPASVQSALKQLPAHAQSDAIEKGVELLAKDNSCIKVKLAELNHEQAKQVFAPNGTIRTPAEQAAVLKAETKQTMAAKVMPPISGYEVAKGKLHVFQPHTFTAAELSMILCRMVEGK